MKTKINAIYFSPTHTTEKIVQTIADSIPNSTVNFIDVTKLDARNEVPEFTDCDLLIVGSPVYSGLAPKLFVDYLSKLKGNGTKAVIIAVFGNRSAGKTCRQLSDLVTQNGFKTIAAAEFIGEHSFSDKEFPIAPKRPDSDDLHLAAQLGRKMPQLLSDNEREITPEVLGEKAGDVKDIIFIPPTVTDSCNECGKCIPVCPVDIIRNNETNCIGCGACIRVCDQNARIFPEKINQYQIKLNAACKERLEPNIFL